jgi:hypothetical protein
MGYVEIVRADGTVVRLGDDGPIEVQTQFCDGCQQRQPEVGGIEIRDVSGMGLMWLCLECRAKHRG